MILCYTSYLILGIFLFTLFCLCAGGWFASSILNLPVCNLKKVWNSSYETLPKHPSYFHTHQCYLEALAALFKICMVNQIRRQAMFKAHPVLTLAEWDDTNHCLVALFIEDPENKNTRFSRKLLKYGIKQRCQHLKQSSFALKRLFWISVIYKFRSLSFCLRSKFLVIYHVMWFLFPEGDIL